MGHSPTEVDLLRAELAELRAEVESLHRQRSDSQTVDHADEDPTPEEPDSNRRGFLKLAGAAAVGATAVAVAGSSQQAAAATGGNMIIGQTNITTAVNDTTGLISASATALDDQTFLVRNFSIGSITPPAALRVAVAGTTSGADASDGQRVGVYGRTAAPGSLGGQGVFGSSEGPENPFGAGFKFGVVGTADAEGYGVFAYSPLGASAVGVLGRADQGFGVIASSFTGVSLLVRDSGRIQQQLRPTTGAPAAGTFSIGEMVRDLAGDMYICTASGTPGTWRKVTAQHPAFSNAGGSINLLPRPIRLVDSRGNGAPITNGSAKLTPGVVVQAQITGTVADSLSVPAGATGILGNLTATEATGPGFALVWPTGQPQPATSNINYSAVTANPAIANYFISALDATGNMNIMCAAASTHILVDVFGFVF